MSDSNLREFKITGGALKKSRKTRKNRQEGGAESFASSAGVPFTPDEGVQSMASSFGGQVKTILTDAMGPTKIQQFGSGTGSQVGGKKSQKGGDSTGATVNLSSTRSIPNAPGSPEPSPTVSGISPSQPAPIGGGGSRVLLAPPKRKTRIALKGKKYGGSVSQRSNIPPGPLLNGGQTRKARKIHLRVKGVTSRLAKAKKAKRTAMSAPISIVKSRLESAGVVKKGSKAPEAMMRTMYADLLITKKGL